MLSRRLFLAGSASLAAVPALLQPVAPMLVRPTGGYPQTGRPIPAGVFRLGVASGDPLPDGVVLWTRLAPPEALGGGGMPARDVEVEWEIAADDRFRRDRRAGVAVARPELAHSVHVEVGGLRPASVYFYRFRVAGQISPTGRTRTAPGGRSHPASLRFAMASCQNYQDGFYSAHAHLAEEDVSFVAFLGDYIYESSCNPRAVRQHEGTGQPQTLERYRARHAQYKTDPDLRAAHAAAPWIVTLDDHDVEGNWAGPGPENPKAESPAAFRARRIAAFQAFYEHMPLRRAALPHGWNMRIHRRLRFGSLARLHVLDTRQYRSHQPSRPAQAANPGRTMTGAAQEKWLLDGLRRRDVQWNLLANQVMWAQNDRMAGPGKDFDVDNWDGYRAQRRRLLEAFGHVSDPVILTGDRHSTWVCDLRTDFDDPTTPVVGAEITGTSISSGGDENARDFHALFDPIMRESPHWRYIDNRRGYVVCHVTAERLEARLRVVNTVLRPAAPVRTAATFTVEAGRPGVAEVSRSAPPDTPARLVDAWPRA